MTPGRKENMDLFIKYEHGSMTIHLEAFLDCRNITKFKKLVKLIQQSYTPDEVNKIKNHIEQFNETYEQEQKVLANKGIAYLDKVRFTERQIANCIFNREHYRKKTDGWNHYNSLVKQLREENRELKALLADSKREFSQGQKNKVFYDKCLEILS